MTSISEKLEIISLDSEAETNEQMRNSSHDWKHKTESFSSKPNRCNFSEKSVQRELQVPSNFTLVNSGSEDREHVKIFDKLFSLFSKYVKVFGVEATYKWMPAKSIMFLFLLCIVIFLWFCMFYTQYIHINNGEILKFLEPCALYGIILSCNQKLLCYLKKRNQILSLFSCIRKICRRTLCGSQADILTFHLLKTLKFWKMYTVGVTASLGLFIVGPIKLYIVDKVITSLLPLEILFVDQSTYLGFAIANAFMTLLGILAALGTILYGAIFIYAILMYALQVDLIGQDFKDLDDMWANGSTVTLGYKQLFLKNICNKQQDIKDFISAIKGIFEKKFCYYFVFNYFSQVICLFEITKNQWLPGYGIAIGLFIEMMFYCVMGSQIGIADDRLCSIIYISDWYKYDLSSQKMVMFMLQRSQQLNELSLGPLGKLNVETGIEIIKNIYAYYTVLTELL